MKFKILQSTCCFGFNLIDGILGIVVWDSLYAIFIVTLSLNTLMYYLGLDSISDSFTDLITAILLIMRAIVGIRTCKHNFSKEKLKTYLITRLVWDGALLILNITMAGLRKISPQTFFSNVGVLFLVDGYLNLIIFSHLRKID